MPIQYCLKCDRGYLEVAASGEIDVLDRAKLVREVCDDATLPEVLPILIDVTEITNIPASDDIWRMAHLAETLANRFKTRIAYLVDAPGFVTTYFLTAFAVREEVADVCAFTERTTAIGWLCSGDMCIDQING